MTRHRDIKVSILCITYNHANYISDAIESFLMQETSFDFEILIHDDASIDGTAEIVREYSERYPDIITAVFQEENQYSKHVPISKTFLLPLAKGKYIASCEGDDCWLRSDKLQRQYDYMEAHPECAACAHQALWSDGLDDANVLGMMGYGDDEADLTADDLIRKWWLPTASMFYRTQSRIAYYKDWSLSGPVGDFPFAIYLADKSYLHYDPMVASRYRYRVPGSYTARVAQGINLKHNVEWIKMCKEIDNATGGRHHDGLIEFAKRYARDIYATIGLRTFFGKIHGVSVGSLFSVREKLHLTKKKILGA